MAKKHLYNIDFAQFAGIKPTAVKALKFLATNRRYGIAPHVVERLYADKPLLETPSNTIFRHLRDEGKLSALFAPLYFDKNASGIPELLLSNEVVLDTAQLSESQILSSFPEFYGKVVVNLSNILRSNRNAPGEYQVTDMHAMHSLFVKGALVMSYNDSETWLTPTLGVYIVKSYSMTISGIIAKLYDLTLQEQLTIAAVFAMYMCQVLDKDSADKTCPTLFNRCTFLGNTTVLNGLISAMAEETVSGLDTAKVCKLVSTLGPDRVRGFSPEIFFRTVKSIGTDVVSSMIAIEYPPYWVHQLVVAMSNGKTKLYFELKANRLHEETKRFLYELDNSPTFIGSLANDGKNRFK